MWFSGEEEEGEEAGGKDFIVASRSALVCQGHVDRVCLKAAVAR